MTYARRSAERIQQTVEIIDVLQHYGYHVRGGGREEQFSCDLHGSGRDAKPSARVYPDSNNFYCYGCGASRDVIALVRAKEDLSFWQAIRAIEKRHGLAPLERGEDETWEDPKRAMNQELAESLAPTKPYEQFFDETIRFLGLPTCDRDLSLEAALRLWETIDKIDFQVRGKTETGGSVWSEAQGNAALAEVQVRITEALKAG